MLRVLQNKYLQLVIILIISTIVIFYNLGQNPINDWDEARYAVNALEILKNRDFIVLHYGHSPDLWNVRPPLGAWLIAISFKIFGYTEFALRFWSALWAVLTIGLIYLFGTVFVNQKVGFFSSLILLSSSQYIGYHSARTGDYDSPITFFIVLVSFLFLLSLKTEQKKYFYISAIPLALGFLYKGVVGFIPLVLIGLFLLFSGKIKKFSLKDYFFFGDVFLVLTLPWITARYLAGKEFFIQMLRGDIYMRATQAIEGHTGGVNYYFLRITEGFNPWHFLLLPALLVVIYLVIKKRSDFYLYLLIWFFTIFLGMTMVQTKLSWYIVPLYPAMALIIGGLFGWLWQLGSKKVYQGLVVFLFFLFLFFASKEIHKIISPVYQPNQFIKQIKINSDKFKQVNNVYISDRVLSQSETFYIESVVEGKVFYCNYFNLCPIKPGDGLVVKNLQVKDKLDKDYTLDLILSGDGFLLYKKL